MRSRSFLQKQRWKSTKWLDDFKDSNVVEWEKEEKCSRYEKSSRIEKGKKVSRGKSFAPPPRRFVSFEASIDSVSPVRIIFDE